MISRISKKYFLHYKSPVAQLQSVPELGQMAVHNYVFLHILKQFKILCYKTILQTGNTLHAETSRRFNFSYFAKVEVNSSSQNAFLVQLYA